MFFSDPTVDMRVIAYCVGIFFVLSVLSYLWLRKILLSILLFSVLSNWVFYGNLTYAAAVGFDLFGLFNFVRHIWPYLNVGAGAGILIYYAYRAYVCRKNR